jgi:hypothetical protein
MQERNFVIFLLHRKIYFRSIGRAFSAVIGISFPPLSHCDGCLPHAPKHYIKPPVGVVFQESEDVE